MLPEELVTYLSGFLAIDELVALGLTCKTWQAAIPDLAYQLVMMRHCPSFTPESTYRSSWQDYARVHVSRLKKSNLKRSTPILKDPKWKDKSHLFEMFQVSLLQVHKNVSVPLDFESFLDDSQRQKAESKDFSMFSSSSEASDAFDSAFWSRMRELRKERAIAKVRLKLDTKREDMSTCREWKEAVPESVYQTVLLRHCPSFVLESTDRKSWEECARVHVARIKSSQWMFQPELFSLCRTAIVEVSRNEPVKKDFESFLDGHYTDLGNNCGRIEYMGGNGIRVRNTVVYLGSDTLGKRIGIEPVTRARLVTSSGVEMDRENLEEGTDADRQIAMSDTGIGFTSFRERADGRGEVQMAVKLNTPGTEPDVKLTLVHSDNNLRMTPFVSNNTASVAAVFHPKEGAICGELDLSERLLLTFMHIQGEGYYQSNDIDFHWRESDVLLWHDGLIVRIRPGDEATMQVHKYDLVNGARQEFTTSIKDIYGARVSKCQRYVVFFDKKMFVGRVWDLKLNVQLVIRHEDRRPVTMVGLSEDKLTITTYDGEFIVNNIPFSQRFQTPKDWADFSMPGEGETTDMFSGPLDPGTKDFWEKRIKDAKRQISWIGFQAVGGIAVAGACSAGSVHKWVETGYLRTALFGAVAVAMVASVSIAGYVLWVLQQISLESLDEMVKQNRGEPRTMLNRAERFTLQFPDLFRRRK
ncbi:hypothetical protein CJU89_5041 [Yarrowia sp. B02]|nr:hypothetical protein CJU89_5041 [Yarrowia sp. B02]